MIAQFVEAPEVLQTITVVPQEVIDQCAVQGVDLEIPVANREQTKNGTKTNVDIAKPLIVPSSWWEKVLEMWFGVFRM